MRILITGATGYVGSHVAAALLKQGDAVHALVRPNSRFDRLPSGVTPHIIQDTNLPDLVKAIAPEVVVHLAATVATAADPATAEKLLQDNVIFGARLLQALAGTPCHHFVNTGTCWEYDESGCYHPNTLYAASKRTFRDLLEFYAGNFAVTTLVLYDAYGPQDWRGKLWPTLADKLNKCEAIALSPGEQYLDLVHVKDIADAFTVAAHAPYVAGMANAWGVASGRLVTLRQAVILLEQAVGKKLNAQWGALAYPPHQIMKPVMAPALPVLPDWQAKISLETGLKSLLTL